MALIKVIEVLTEVPEQLGGGGAEGSQGSHPRLCVALPRSMSRSSRPKPNDQITSYRINAKIT